MKPYFLLIALTLVVLDLRGQRIDPAQIDIIRDQWGVPHIDAPTDELLHTLARLVPNGAPRRAYGSKGHPHLRRNFLLAVSTVAGAAQQGAPHSEATHAALSNISHAIVGHHHAMLEADAQWHALHEQARTIALKQWHRSSNLSSDGVADDSLRVRERSGRGSG